MSSRFPAVPAAFFGMVLGLCGLSGSWRAAHLTWGLPAEIGEAIMIVASLVWAALIALYIGKWIMAREAALAEIFHPVHCCFVGLAGVATMLVAGGAETYSRNLALALYTVGAIFTVAFAIWRTGALWQGGRDPAHTTAVLYLPTVAGGFVGGIEAAGLGLSDIGQYTFGAGLFAWFAIESVLLHRLLIAPNLASTLRPTLGIQLAPPAVGAVTLIAVAPSVPFPFVHAMIGYGVLQALILLRLLPWILKEPFTPAYWAFTFGVTALATAPIRLIELGDQGVVTILAPILFVFANIVVLVVALGTVFRIVQGRLLPNKNPLLPPLPLDSR
ncbi:MAG TPA: dicarboxylate transporter/tellurite-resistance protein TehA [Afipia sp.]